MRKLIGGRYVPVDASGQPVEDNSAKGPKQNAAASAAQGRQDAVPAGGGKKLTLYQAVQHLDPARPEHWTQGGYRNKGGLPDLRVLTELTGRRVKRKEVNKAFPGLTRETAKTGVAE